MKSLRLFAPGDLRLQNEPVPEVGPKDVLIRIRSVGLCASDLHWFRDGRIGTTVMTEPLVLGHETAGEIAAVGDEVTHAKVGDRVAVEPAYPCGQCDYCSAGEVNVCPTVRFLGTPPTDGALREYIAWPENLVVPIPDSMSFDAAAMIEPLAIGIYAVELASLAGGERIAVLGAGGIGLSVLQAARLAGASEIYVIEPVPERREAALRFGATRAFSPEEAQEEIRKLTAYGPDVVFECAGENDSVRKSTELARPLGKVMVVGIPEGDDYVFAASASRRKQLTAIFVRRSKHTAERAITLIQSGDLDADSLATHRFPLEQTGEAMKLAMEKADGMIRAVIRIGD